jgi:hypothetical protein
LKACEKR